MALRRSKREEKSHWLLPFPSHTWRTPSFECCRSHQVASVLRYVASPCSRPPPQMPLGSAFLHWSVRLHVFREQTVWVSQCPVNAALGLSASPAACLSTMCAPLPTHTYPLRVPRGRKQANIGREPLSHMHSPSHPHNTTSTPTDTTMILPVLAWLLLSPPASDAFLHAHPPLSALPCSSARRFGAYKKEVPPLSLPYPFSFSSSSSSSSHTSSTSQSQNQPSSLLPLSPTDAALYTGT